MDQYCSDQYFEICRKRTNIFGPIFILVQNGCQSKNTNIGKKTTYALGSGGVPPCVFSILPPIVKKSQDISKKVRDISQIHAISQKNVAIYIIATFYAKLGPGSQMAKVISLTLKVISFFFLPILAAETFFSKKKKDITKKKDIIPYIFRVFRSKSPYIISQKTSVNGEKRC